MAQVLNLRLLYVSKPLSQNPHFFRLGVVCTPPHPLIENPHPRHPHPPGELTEFNPMAAFRAVQGPSTKGAALHPMGPHHQL